MHDGSDEQLLEHETSSTPLPTTSDAGAANPPPPPPGVPNRWSRWWPAATAAAVVAIVLALVVGLGGRRDDGGTSAPTTTVYVPTPRDDSPAEARRVMLERLAEDFIRAYQQGGPPEELRARVRPMSDDWVAEQAARGHYLPLRGQLCCAPTMAPTAARDEDYALYTGRLSNGQSVSVQMKMDASGRWHVFEFSSS